MLGHDVRVPADTAEGGKTSPSAPFTRMQTLLHTRSLCPSRHALCSLADGWSAASGLACRAEEIGRMKGVGRILHVCFSIDDGGNGRHCACRGFRGPDRARLNRDVDEASAPCHGQLELFLAHRHAWSSRCTAAGTQKSAASDTCARRGGISVNERVKQTGRSMPSRRHDHGTH